MEPDSGSIRHHGTAYKVKNISANSRIIIVWIESTGKKNNNRILESPATVLLAEFFAKYCRMIVINFNIFTVQGTVKWALLQFVTNITIRIKVLFLP